MKASFDERVFLLYLKVTLTTLLYYFICYITVCRKFMQFLFPLSYLIKYQILKQILNINIKQDKNGWWCNYVLWCLLCTLCNECLNQIPYFLTLLLMIYDLGKLKYFSLVYYFVQFFIYILNSIYVLMQHNNLPEFRYACKQRQIHYLSVSDILELTLVNFI